MGKGVIEGLDGSISSSEKSKGLGEILGTGILKGLGNFIGGSGLALVGAVIAKLGIQFTSFALHAAKNLTDITGSLQAQKVVQAQIGELLAANPKFQDQILKGSLSIAEKEKLILETLKLQTIEREKATAIIAGSANAVLRGGFNTKTGTFPKSAALGYVPNFNSDENNQERLGAMRGGYQPGTIRNTNIPGLGKVIYNAAETVKDFGLAQPAIMPPANSSAGQNYRRDFTQKLAR